MSTEHPTASWQAMQDGNVFYKRQQLYTIHDKLPNLDDYVVAGCRFGGPLAMMRDTTKLTSTGRSMPSFAKNEIRVYSSAGEGLVAFTWNQGRIIKLGWTFDEQVVVVNEEGVFRVYDLQGDYHQFSLGADAAETGVIDARIHENGLVVLTGALALLEVKGWEGGKPLMLASTGLTEPPHSWAVIPPDLSTSRHVEVLLSVGASIVSVDALEAADQRLSRGPFTHLAPAPNGRSLALLTHAGLLWVVSSDFARSLAEFDTAAEAAKLGAEGTAKQVEWCGNDAVLVTWERLAILVGPFGDTLTYFYTGAMHAISEVDGVRVVGPDVCDLIQKVPAPSVSVFRPGSTAPAAILFDAWENFEKRAPKADESIRSIRPELAAAVNECVDAAGREWEPTWQRKLLNAAKFGRSFLDLYDPTDYVNMGQTLKVLNAVRFYEIGIPITYDQYTYNSPAHLITRLTARSLHLLALRISTYLALKPDAVLKHWACAKIAKAKPAGGVTSDADAVDRELCKAITEKFRSVGGGGVSYADIAKRSWEVGRPGLATKLLDYETQAADQVPLLLEMKEDRLALAKAVNSGDTDLVYHVLLHLHKRLPLGSFFRLIEEGGPALAPASKLLQVYAREQNREMLRDFYYSDDRRVDSAVLCLEEASTMTDPNARISSVKAAQKFFSEDKDRAFEAKMMDENVRLLTYQQQLEKEADGKIKFFGLTVSETIRTCLMNGMARKSEKVRADFKVPDKRFWYIKLDALIAMRDFEGLDTFAKSKKSPIGYEPFVRHLILKGHNKEAASYVARCDASKRVDLYVECGEWRMAAKEAKDRGDRAKLEQLKKSAPNSLIVREIESVAGVAK